MQSISAILQSSKYSVRALMRNGKIRRLKSGCNSRRAYRNIAQLVEQRPYKPCVDGSIPSVPITPPEVVSGSIQTADGAVNKLRLGGYHEKLRRNLDRCGN